MKAPNEIGSTLPVTRCVWPVARCSHGILGVDREFVNWGQSPPVQARNSAIRGLGRDADIHPSRIVRQAGSRFVDSQIERSAAVGLGRQPGLFAVPNAPLASVARLAGKGEAWARLDGDLVVSTEALRATGWWPVIASREALAKMMQSDDP